MKLWVAILFTLLIIIVLVLSPREISNPLASVIGLGSALWIYIDAGKLETKKYQSALGISAGSLALFTILFWPILFPGYLSLRYKIKHNLVAVREKNIQNSDLGEKKN
jgi:hypothetical protein